MSDKKYPLGPDIDLDEEVVLDPAGRRITEARAEEIAEDVLSRLAADEDITIPLEQLNRDPRVH